MIYFDNAATTGKKPESVIAAVNTALKCYCANPGRSGHKLSSEAALKIYSIREKAAKMFGATGPENVVFTSGCTESLNVVIKGVLKPQDHVIISDLEHNAVLRPLYKIGVDYSIARVSFTSDEETLDNFRREIRPDTKMIICTGASNVIGKRLPITEIGRLCRENGLLFTVDAAQIAGVFPINMAEMNIDFLCIAPHKGLYAPMGTGLLIAEKNIENTLIEGGTGTDSANPEQPADLPERLESGTLALPAIFGLSAGMEFVGCKNMNNIFRHEISITERIYKAISHDERFTVYTPDPSKYSYAPVLSFNLRDKASEETASILNDKGIAVRAGLHCAPLAHKRLGTERTGTVRVAPSAFTTVAEADYLIRTLKNIKS